MRLPTPDEMAALDRRAADEFSTPTLLLMEAAGRGVFEAARRLVARPTPRVVVVAGKGNNGGDGLVAARMMLAAGWRVTVLLLARDADVGGDAAVNLQAARRAGVEVINLDSTGVAGLRGLLAGAELLVDGLFGTGLQGPAVGLAGKAIDAMNASGQPILAIDIPSGVHGGTGQVDGPAVRASWTVTMGLPKVGLLLSPGAQYCGRIWVADVGHPARLLESTGVRTSLVTRDIVDAALPVRRFDAHKGEFGRILIVAGSVGHSGAAVLATLGALRAGAGLVTLGIPRAVYPIVGPAVLEGMPEPLPDDDGALAAAADVVACGPGLSTGPGPTAVIRRLLRECPRPLVFDADALNIVAGDGEFTAPGPMVITPHPGEMARLLRAKTEEVQKHRLQTARVAARRFNTVVVLKGARTVVAEPGGEACVVATGNAAMAAGGMGDVLTGVVAALIGQGLTPSLAGSVGAYLHGLAGDLVAGEVGPLGVLAREVADAIPRALARVRARSVQDIVAALPVS